MSNEATASGSIYPFKGIGTIADIASRASWVAIMSATIGVFTIPGPTALSGIPAPAQRALMLSRRTQRQIARLAPGEAGPGDLFIQLHVKPHPIFSRKGENLMITLPVTFAEAALGADIKVPTMTDDDVTVRIAPGTPNGRTLRVKGRGIVKGSTTGDLLVTVEVQVPQRVDGKALDALRTFAFETESEDVRADFANKAKI